MIGNKRVVCENGLKQMDVWTKKKRSLVMARILGKNTKPEIKTRQILHSMGYRFRIHNENLPGKPDIVIAKHKTIIFVHGCFWHLHSGCRDGTIPKTRIAYWRNKLLTNKRRDAGNIRRLRRLGWKVLRLWECEIERKPEKVHLKIIQTLKEC